MNFDTLLTVTATAIGLYATLLAYVKILGLRSFAEMTALDLAITVAIGTVIASTLLPSSPTYVDGFVVLALLFIIQYIVSKVRQKSKFIKSAIENSPILVMDSKGILSENLKKTLLTKGDLMAKLREANAYDLSKVKGVIFETTGDISVLHGEGEVSEDVLRGVQQANQ